MRIGIDAHIVLPQHKRYDRRIARYTEDLITHLIEADTKKEHTWVLFFDERMKNTKKFERENVEIRRFPFIQYRTYLPVVYSHMLISSFLATARLDIFHSPEGLIPYLYPGRIVTTFHYVPRGGGDSSLFVRTFMLGARVAFSRLCRRAKSIVVNKQGDKRLLVERHKVPKAKVVVMEQDDIARVDWSQRVKDLMRLYRQVTEKKTRTKKASATKKTRRAKSRTAAIKKMTKKRTSKKRS